MSYRAGSFACARIEVSDVLFYVCVFILHGATFRLVKWVSLMRVNCNCCHGKALISEVDETSPGTNKLYCLCLNARCGHSFVMELSFSHTLKPSAKKVDESLFERFRGLSNAQQLQMFEHLESLK